MMADGYARIKKKPGVTMVTSGPGAQNLITGIASSWFDSIPTIHICGQVNSNDFLISKKNYPVRQRGFQETDIVSISKPPRGKSGSQIGISCKGIPILYPVHLPKF